MWTFYITDHNAQQGRVKTYSAVSFPSKEIAEKWAKEVSVLMGGVKWGVEEIVKESKSFAPGESLISLW